MRHIALIHPIYARAILAGAKTCESRLSRARIAPWGCVDVGHQIIFVTPRTHAVPRMAVACVVSRVLSISNLSTGGVANIRRHYNEEILGTPAYWSAKRSAKYATLVWLSDVRVQAQVPEYTLLPTYLPRKAWFVAGAVSKGTTLARAAG